MCEACARSSTTARAVGRVDVLASPQGGVLMAMLAGRRVLRRVRGVGRRPRTQMAARAVRSRGRVRDGRPARVRMAVGAGRRVLRRVRSVRGRARLIWQFAQSAVDGCLCACRRVRGCVALLTGRRVRRRVGGVRRGALREVAVGAVRRRGRVPRGRPARVRVAVWRRSSGTSSGSRCASSGAYLYGSCRSWSMRNACAQSMCLSMYGTPRMSPGTPPDPRCAMPGAPRGGEFSKNLPRWTYALSKPSP